MTDEDKKLILEWCGFKRRDEWWDIGEESIPNWELVLDPNFYFKYPVPKLEFASISRRYFPDIDKYRYCGEIHGNSVIYYAESDEDPAEAFGQALVKFIKDKK